MNNEDHSVEELFQPDSVGQIEGEFLLADYVSSAGGKLTVVGTWSVTGPVVGPHALGAHLRVPVDQTPVDFRMELLDEDGRAVLPEPIVGQAGGTLAEDLPPGTPIDLPIAMVVGPLPLKPNARYEWRLTVNGRTYPHWRKGFFVRAAPPSRKAS